MMQALEQGLGSLRLAIRRWLNRAGWRRERQAMAGKRLARDLGLPAEEVSNILDHAVADLKEISDEDGDPWPIIDRAVHEIDELGGRDDPTEDVIVAGYLRQLPERDRQILGYFNDGKKHSEIAELMGTDVDAVCNSLVATYTSLRLRMLHRGDDPPRGTRQSSGVGDAMKPVKAGLQQRTI